MPIFKQAEIKKMLGHVQSEQMTFSRMVELLNQKAFAFKAKKGDAVTNEDVINTLECFLSQNKSTKSNVQFKINSLIDVLKLDEVNRDNGK